MTAVNGTLTVTQAAPAMTLTSSAASAVVDGSVTFTAALSSTAATGNVSFYDGTALWQTMSPAAGAAACSTSTLSAGTHSIAAACSGDVNFVAVTSAAVTETIGNLSLGTAGGGSTSAAVSPGGQATYSLTVAPPSGATFPAAVTFAVAGLPAGATGTFSPSSVSAGAGSTNVTLTVAVPATSAQGAPGPIGKGTATLVLAPIVLPFFSIRRLRAVSCRRAGWIWLFGTAIAVCVSGCGGGNTGGGGGQTPQTYTLNVTAACGSASGSSTLALTVE